MTFTGPTSASWGAALADLRDTVGGMTNWSIKDDSSGGATSLARGDYFVLTNALGEDIRILVTNSADNGYSGIIGEYGPSWDASAGSWASKYSNGPRGRFHDTADGQYSDDDQCTLAPLDPADTLNSLSMSDSGQYWVAYADAVGFYFYFERMAGDGSDGDVGIGWAEVNKIWDYSTANAVESGYTYAWAGARHNNDNSNNNAFRKQMDAWNVMGESGTLNDHGHGARNPDANFDNFPFNDPWMNSSQFQNDSGNNVIIGTHDVWLNDRSGTALNHKDTVTDGAGTTTHTVLKKLNLSVAVKHI